MSVDRLNLIAEDLLVRKKAPMPIENLVGVGVAIVFIFLGGLTYKQLKKLQSTRSKIEELTKNKEALKREVAAISVAEFEQIKKHEKFRIIQDLLGQKIIWSDIFQELSLLTPKNVWLVNLETAKSEAAGVKTIKLIGEAGSQTQVAEFFAALESSFFFRRVIFNYSERVEKMIPPLFRFQFEAQIPDFDHNGMPKPAPVAGTSDPKKDPNQDAKKQPK